MDYTVYGIPQARIPEWVAFPFSGGSSQPRDLTQVSCIAGGFFTSCISCKELISKIHKDSFNSTTKTQTTKTKKRQRLWTDIFPRKTYRCQKAHERMPTTANQQGNSHQNHSEVSPHTSERPSSERQEITNAGAEWQEEGISTAWHRELCLGFCSNLNEKKNLKNVNRKKLKEKKFC